MKPKAILSLALAASQITACAHSPRTATTQTGAASEEHVARDVAEEHVDDSVKGTNAKFDFAYDPSLKSIHGILGKDPIKEPSDDLKLLLTISGRRSALLKKNLMDTGVDPHDISLNCAEIMKVPHRTATGLCYYFGQGQLEDKLRAGDNEQRFGRNAPAEVVNTSFKKYDLMDPNPREVSLKLLTRKNGQTKEADIINVLAAAWLQAQNHDWFSHGKNARPEQVRAHSVPVAEGERASEFADGMKVPQTRPDRSSLGRHGYEKTFRNTVTHWWDASHIYGSDQATIDRVRTNPLTGKTYDDEGRLGHIAVDVANRRLYYDENGLPITGFNDNWWLGLELIHSLFAMEHNHIANKLRQLYPKMTGEEIFQKARLINAALIAKIHTVEWTPALLDNKALHLGMHMNYFGARAAWGRESVFLRRILGRVYPEAQHAVSGVVGPGTLTTANVPFTLTEEFVAVYRMHPLIPESVFARSPQTGNIVTRPVAETTFRRVPGLLGEKKASLMWMYGLGTGHPGGLFLNNHPTFMQNIHAERNLGQSNGDSDAVRMDLAAVDILRDRERGVPRYNDFRRTLRLKPIKTWSDLTDSAEEQAALQDVYGNDVEKLDLLVGTLAEKDRYAGYAFGNTPFYIFALMASRRLMADPFFSDYYTHKVYTKFGIDWAEKQTMTDVIKRHYPELSDKFKGVKNAFRPWQPVYETVRRKYAN